ncbi:MAG TPA: chemotaxis protein CheD [Aquabacterium sp.]|nr:chemotaxis protein CheD [Aquabacterium sp.]
MPHSKSAPRPSRRAVKLADIGMVVARPGQDVHLLAGQLYFGNTAARVHTLLGSCVAITLWNPARQLGGMCHYLLPTRQRASNAGRDGRFGDESLEMLVEALTKAGTLPRDYHVNLYGGADTLPDTNGHNFNVGARNIEQGWRLIEHYGFVVQNVDVGDHVPRNVAMTFPDGNVSMRRGKSMKP